MAVTHGFIINEAATSVTAPLTATAGLQVVVGTAPVNMLDDPAAAVNTPMIVRSYKEAVEAAGYSDDFEDYTICEAVNASFQVMNVGPLVLINVLDPAKHTTAVKRLLCRSTTAWPRWTSPACCWQSWSSRRKLPS